MKPRFAVPSWANPVFLLALWSVTLWSLDATAQLDSNSFGPVIPRGSSALYTFAVAAGDLDGDGFADLVVSDQCGLDGLCNTDRHTGVQVMINNGDGSFHLGTRYATDHDGGSPQSVAIADVDGDHKLDVIVLNASGSVSVMLGNGDGTLQNAVSYPLSIYANLGVSPDRLTVADVNGDGKPDILVADALNYTNRFDASQFRGGVSVLLNQGNGTFADAALYDSGGYYGAVDIRVADLNHDGFRDIVVLNICSVSTDNRVNGSPCNDATTGLRPGTVGVLLGNGDGTFQQAITYPSGGYGPVGLAVADPDRDGNPDVLVANHCSNAFCNDGVSGGKVSVLMGNPDGSFDAPVNYDDGTLQPVSVAVADIDGDGAADAAVLNYCAVGQGCDGSSAIVAGLLGNGDGTLQPLVPPVPPLSPLYPFGGAPHTVLLVDLNNDGKPDLVVGFWTGVGVRLNQTPRSATVTGLASQPNPSGDGKTVTFTATVSSSAPGVPSGTVTFREGAAILGTAPLVTATATLNVSSFSIGNHDVVASYSSDNAFRASDSAPLTQVVKASTSTSVNSSANPSPFQQSVTFTATVTALLGGAPSGNVTFKDGAAILGSSPLAGNTAALSTSSLSVGTHSITALYGGDANHVGSTSTVLSQVIVTAPTATTTAATAIMQTGATLNATVSANGASTTVLFGYGLTTAYGASLAATQSPLPGGASGAAVSVPISGLTCGTLYHFHVTANNGTGGDIDGGDLTFTTIACAPVLQGAVSRKVHGAAGTFDLPLSLVTPPSVNHNPTTEPRQGPAQTIVFTFDKPLNGATVTITEGTATAGAPTLTGNSVVVPLAGVNNQQYVTVTLTNVASTDGGTGGSGTVRIGFLAGDVNQSRVVSLADFALVNAQLSQPVTASNFLKDVNANGALTLADKAITNTNLTKALPVP